MNRLSCSCGGLSYLSEFCKITSHGFLVADDAGTIRFATEKAIRWLEEYFGETHSRSLPLQLSGWLQARSPKLFDHERRAEEVREISIQRGSKRLIIQSLSPWQAKEHRLVLLESTDPLDPTPLEKLGLTRREAEVLFWAGQAKRNAEIGQILAIGERTVRTHMGRILAKLGVENRTAAANIAIELLRLSAPTTSQKAPTHANGRE